MKPIFLAFSILTLLALGSPAGVLAQEEPLPDSAQSYTYQLPKGSMIPVLLQEELTTSHSLVGQPFSAIVAQDIFVGQTRVLSKSDRLLGHITRSEPPIQGRHAILEVSFDYLLLQQGIRLPIAATAKTDDGQAFWGGQATPGTVPEVIPYHVWRIGTYGRVMYRGPREMGEHVQLPPGTRILVILNDPLSLFVI